MSLHNEYCWPHPQWNAYLEWYTIVSMSLEDHGIPQPACPQQTASQTISGRRGHIGTSDLIYSYTRYIGFTYCHAMGVAKHRGT